MSIIEKLGITPGPWGIDKKVPGIYDAIGPAEVRGEYCSDYWIDCSDEDARLIATAPEMLEALIRSAKILEHIDHIKIIEKATGKTWGEVKELIN